MLLTENQSNTYFQIVLATAKIHILKQFTTYAQTALALAQIVLAAAKIHILKQFTTRAGIGSGFSELCLLLQRYTF